MKTPIGWVLNKMYKKSSILIIFFLKYVYLFPNSKAFEIQYQKTSIEILNKTFLKNGDSVILEWSGIPNPKSSDKIGIYCPVNSLDNEYKRIYDNKDFEDLGKSSGRAYVRVFYPRIPCEFRYLKTDSDKFYSIVNSGEILFEENKLSPTQIHISIKDFSNMWVTWVSGSLKTPIITYFSEKSYDVKIVECSTTTYKADDMCEPPATTHIFLDPGFIHSGVIPNLDPGVLYSYSVGDGHVMSDWNFFRSPHILDKQNLTYSFVMFGDLDITPFPGAYGTIQRIYEKLTSGHNINAIFHIGDISYAMGNSHKWEEFFRMIQPIASKVPYMVTIGNHEHNHIEGHDKDLSNDGENFRPLLNFYINDSGGECGVPMVHRFKVPNTGNNLFWYYFDYGIVRFISLSSEHDFQKNSKQYKWFKNVLKNTDRKLNPWIIVLIHRTLYTVSYSHNFDATSDLLRKHLEPLLIKYKVDFLVGGHYHLYERTCCVRYETCVSEIPHSDHWGTVHLTVGAAGRKLNDPVIFNQNWSEISIFEHGYGKLTVESATKATWTFRMNKNGDVIDKIDYYRDHNF